MSKYIEPKRLFQEIIISKEKGELTPSALEMLMAIPSEVSRTLKFKNEEDRVDCIAFAIEDLIKYWKGFNPSKSDNAFSYYTQMAKNGMAKGWKKLHGKTTSVKFIAINEVTGITNI